MNRAKLCVLVLVVALGVLVLAVPVAGAAQKVIPPNATPNGLSYSEWSVKWWQWVLSIPQDENPCFDQTGENVAVGQEGHVWFLAGTMEPDNAGAMKATRTATIPHGTMLFVPILNSELSHPEAPGATWQDLIDMVTGFIDAAKLTELEVDGRAVPVTQGFRVHSTAVEADAPTYTMPSGGVLEPYGVTPGTYSFYCDGYYVMLAPLATGEHTIVIHGRSGTDAWTFETEVTYYLTVK